MTIYAQVSLDDKPRALGKLGRALAKTVPINNALGPSSSGASLPSSTTRSKTELKSRSR